MHRRIARLALVLGALTASLATSWSQAQDVAAPQYKPGDSWTYRETDNFTRLDRGTVVSEVTGANDSVQLATRTNDGRVLGTTALDNAGGLKSGAINARAAGELNPSLALRPFPLIAGKRWSQTVRRADPATQVSRSVRVSGRVIGWETVRVPAGEFKALRIEREMMLGDADAFRGESLRHETEWYVPELGAPVKLTVREHYRDGAGAVMGPLLQQDWYTRELVAHKRG